MKREVINHGTPKGDYVSKYVIDIKIETVAIEHRFYGDLSIPLGLRPDVQYGSELKALIATLAGQGLVASNTAQETVSAMFTSSDICGQIQKIPIIAGLRI
jgi:hypothetical protein